MSSGCDGGRTSCYYTSPRIVHIGTSSLQLHRLLHTHGEGTDRRTLRKKQVLVSGSFLDQELSYFDTTHPGDKRVCWAHVVARVRGTCRGTCSESMLWDVFEAYVVGDVVGLCFGMCSGPIFWDMVGAYVLGHGRSLYCGMCTPLMLWKVPSAHVFKLML